MVIESSDRGIARASRWIRRFHPVPDSPVRLVCLPHAGGSASFYFPMSAALAPDVECLAVQYPGRQDRCDEPLLTSVADLVSQIREAIRGFTDKPLALFGHSMGAILAYEVASRLSSEGRGPIHVFASARPAPSVRREGEPLHLQPDAGLLAGLQRLGGVDVTELSALGLLPMILPVVRADFQVVETYRPGPSGPLSCPVTVLVGDRDPVVTVDDARVWARHTTAETDLHVLRGGHFAIVDRMSEVVDLVRGHLRPSVG